MISRAISRTTARAYQIAHSKIGDTHGGSYRVLKKQVMEYVYLYY